MTGTQKRLPAFFYRSASGAEPVRQWLKGLSGEDRRGIGYDISLVEFGWPVGMPLCRALGAGLWEIRTALTGGRIVRIMFCVEGGRIVLLHGFIKKTEKAPQRDLDVARQRHTEVAR